MSDYFNGNELAKTIFYNKYSLNKTETPQQLWERVSNALSKYPFRLKKGVSKIGEKILPTVDTEEKLKIQTYDLVKDFGKLVPNGSVLAGIGTDEPVSLSNCFVVSSPHDSYGGIFEIDEYIAQIAKRRGGVGFDISTLRPAGANVNNAAKTSTGAVSFLERYSHTTNEVAQSGRRGALIVTIDVRHPDVFEFATIKRDLTKVTGANLSIKLSNEFMSAVKNNDDFLLTFPVDKDFKSLVDLSELKYNKLYPVEYDNGKVGYVKKVKAKKLWDTIIDSAHSVAEPGLIFYDTMIDYAPDGVYDEYKVKSTNPCFVANTKILTDKGYKKIGDLVDVKDLKLVNERGDIVPAKVWSNGNKKVIKLHLSNGKSITCTPDHVFKTIFGDELQAKDLLDKPLAPFYNFETNKAIEAPVVVRIENIGEKQEVFDFSLKDKIHWGVVEGVIAHNCSEVGMGFFDACRLMTINLVGFVKNPYTENAYFDFNDFQKSTYLSMLLMDNLINEEEKHIKRIILKIEQDQKDDPENAYVYERELNLWKKILNTALETRRTGLGFMGLADMLASLGIKYDSDEALDFVDEVMKFKLSAELDATIDLAIMRGPFAGYDKNKEYDKDGKGKNEFFETLRQMFPEKVERMKKYGRRNLSWSTVAPTGSISLVAQVSSGIEPVFMPYYIKRNKVSDGDDFDFVDEVGVKWKNYFNIHPGIKRWLEVKGYTYKNEDELKELIKKSPYYKSFAQDIDWQKRVDMQSVVQKYTTHSISSTINLPESVSKKVVSDIYFESWNRGLKGITVYRDGSRSGVYVSTDKEKKSKDFQYTPAYKRPKKIKADAWKVRIAGRNFNIFIGLITSSSEDGNWRARFFGNYF